MGYYDDDGNWIEVATDGTETNLGKDAGPLTNENSGTQDMSGWKYNNGVWTSPTGVQTDLTYLNQTPGLLDTLNKALGTKLTTADLAKFGVGAGAFAGLAGLTGVKTTPTGYQGGIPKLTASQPMLTAPPADRRPGSGGINYGTGVQYKDDKGNIVSDTSTPIEQLLAAAKANPFNQKDTYGVVPTVVPRAASTQTFVAPKAQTKAVVDESINSAKMIADRQAAADRINADILAQNQAAAKAKADAAAKIQADAAAAAAANKATEDAKAAAIVASQAQKAAEDKAAAEKAASDKAAADAVKADTGKPVVGKPIVDTWAFDKVAADKAAADKAAADAAFAKTPEGMAKKIGVELPANWSNLGAQEKIDFFNAKNIDPSKLLTAGVAQADIDWMTQHGYNGTTINQGIAAGTALPTGWNNLGAQEKIDSLNKNNVGIDALTKAGTSTADIDWMKQNGYTGGVAPAAPAAFKLPTDWGVQGGQYGDASQKIDYFNQNKISADQLAGQGISQDDIDWMKAHGYQGMAQGGITTLNHGGFVIPADVVSHFGNGSSEAGLKLLKHKLGATPIKGHGDGMSDSIPASIDGQEKALVANEEAYISPKMVERLGDGDMDEGSRKLKHMMEQIRKARTGTTQQGKQVNPNKFMPGGSVGYAQGGSVQHFAAGDAVASQTAAGVTGTEQNLSNWVGPYATDMLGKAQALANTKYQAYTGPLTAGTSGLQTSAFTAANNLTTPSSIGTASANANALGDAAAQYAYTPTSFSNQFFAPTPYINASAPQYAQLVPQNAASTFQAPQVTNATTFTNQYNAPASYATAAAPQYAQLAAQNVASTFQAPQATDAINFTNQYKAPTPYDNTTFTNQYQAPTPYDNTTFTSGTFGNKEAQAYMNPYLLQALNPQLEEARRQADIQAQADQARATAAGAFGGGRQALMASENRRNLNANLANLTGQGYNTAYTNAMSQYNQDQGRNLQAQQASEASKQFGANQKMTAAQLMAQYGLSAQQASEASKQFGATQNMTAAQLAAQYGLSAQQAQEAARQANQNYGLQAATTAGQQGLQAAMANQSANLTAGQGNINAALAAAQQMEASRQFGANQAMTAADRAANYGLSTQQATEAARQANQNYGLQAATTAGSQSLQAALANQSAGLTAGQGNINAALAAAQQVENSRQFGAGQAMTAAQQAANYGMQAAQATENSNQFANQQGLAGLTLANNAYTNAGNLGALQNSTDLNNLRAQADLGATQRAIQSEGIAADRAQFEAARQDPYTKLQFQQSMLNGLPISATNYNMAQLNALQAAAGGATTVAQLLKNLGYTAQ